MMYLYTPEVHAQIVEALERYQVKRQDFDRFADELAMLKAMQPVEPQCYGLYVEHDGQLVLQFPVHDTTEGCIRDLKMYAKNAGYEIRSFYTPTKNAEVRG